MPQTKLKGMTTIEALLVAAAFIIVGVIGLMVFQGMGSSMAQSLRADAIATAGQSGFEVTVEVLNGRLGGVFIQYAPVGQALQPPISGTCYPQNNPSQTVSSDQLSTLNGGQGVVAGQSITCYFQANLQPGTQYTYVILAVDGNTGKEVQLARGVITVGLS